MADVQNRKFKLRVTYKKCGVAIWLSQLELARALEHLVRRSGLPYAVSEGFSPHMRISFGPALSVGIEAMSQTFDIYLKDYIAPKKCLDALQKASQDCLEPISCEYVDNKTSIIVNEVAKFEVTIDKAVAKISVPDEIKTIKKHKEKCLKVSDFLSGEVKLEKVKEGTQIKFSLKQTDAGGLNPSKFVDEMLKKSKLDSARIINFKKL